MRNRILATISIMFLIYVTSASSQWLALRPMVLPLKGGGSVAVCTVSEPADAANPFMSLASVEFDGVIHRTIVNKSAGYYFGYDLIITRMPESRQFKVMVKPLGPDDEESIPFKKRDLGRPEQKGITPTLSQPSTPQIVEDGASFAIDLLINNKTGAKVYDTIKVSFDDLQPVDSPRRLPTRDFTLNDVELNVSNYRLLMNGNVIASNMSNELSAPIIWFGLPGKGRFIFSVTAREGYNFQKIAVADHNNLSFTIDGDHYVWSSTSPIIERGGNWNIWVLHDTDFKSGQEPPSSLKLKKTPNQASADTLAQGLCWGIAKRIEDLFQK